MDVDERHSFIIENIVSLTQLDRSSKSNVSSQLNKSLALTIFLDDVNLRALKVIAYDDGSLDIVNDLSSTDSDNSQGKESNRQQIGGLLFVKRGYEPISPQNIAQCLDVHSIQQSPLDSLYTALNGVWCPILNDQISPHIQQILGELESSLSASSSSSTSSSSSSSAPLDLENVSDIIEPIDEINFWLRIKDDRRSSYKDIARQIDQALAEISSPGFSSLDDLDFPAVSDLVNRSLDALNSAWLASSSGDDGGRRGGGRDRDRDGPSGSSEVVYPQRRMIHFFDCIGSSFCRYIQRHLSGIDIWRGRIGDVRSKMDASIRLCEQWCDVPRKLTTTFWPGSSHRWIGKAHEDSYCAAFKRRLEHILRIRILSEELSGLLSQEERHSFQIDSLFQPLEDAKPLKYNPYTEPQWARAVAEYEKSIDPVETAVATHFRKLITPVLDRPQLLLNEFQKYKNLIERPTIRRTLISEREMLLTLLRDLVKQMEASVDALESGHFEDTEYDDDLGGRRKGNSGDGRLRTNVGGGFSSARPRLLSPRIAGIVLLRQLGAKASNILNMSQGLLNDLSGFSKFSVQCEALVSRTKSEENGMYETWLSDIQNRIEDDDPALSLRGSLMAWKDGVLVVNFSEDLVRFLREVRQLDELGFDIPKGSGGKRGSGGNSIADRALEAEKFYRYGILLKKTANFYNSISEQMIDVQEQLLLDSLTAFASIVSKDRNDVTWSNPADCENYIRSLQDAADKLSSENRWLRKVHESLCAQTVALGNIDLLRQSEAWKAKWRVMKQTMQTVRSKYSEKDSRLWILHWDHQVYKALEASYQMGLASLSENLPEIKIELVFSNKGGRLEFKPPLEQIRQTYYYEMKKFVSLPNNFEGFGNVAVYKRMGRRNASRLIQVYQKGEILFSKLSALLKRYEEHVWLGGGKNSLYKYIQDNVHSPDDYIANFKMMRTRRKDIDRLPDLEKVDCCAVSLTPFKGYLEDLLHQFNDSLLMTLRNSLVQEFKEVDDYLEYAMQKLSTRPHTVEEIGTAKREWKEIDAKKDVMKASSKACVDKKKLLMQYAAGTPVNIGDIAMKMSTLDGEGGRWDEFDIALEAFNDMIEEQKEALKTVLEEEALNLNVNIDKFGSRWRQLKPGDVKSWENSELQKVFESLDNWKKQFEDIQKEAAVLTESCLMFNMSKPRFDGLDALLEDLNATNKSWDMLKAFNGELQEINEQSWMTFSTNVYVLQDFASKWADSLKVTFAKGSYDSVADHVISTVEQIKKSVPALKYCRGEPFKEDHWTELLQGKLQLPREVTRQNLKVSHFISRLDILMEPATLSFVKNLQARALGEVQIREALQELKVWERSAEIKLLTTKESGRRLPLIKDWKDLFSEMGDKQSLLGSLKESPFFKAFADQGLALEVKMSTLDFVLHTLNSIQRKWVYLEPIFGRGALPSEEGRFKRVDDDFSDIMSAMSKNSKLFSLADESIFPHLSDTLRNMLDQLDRCQKALTDFLEAKRESMPRFYFIGDDDLLEILGQAKNPNVIQSHLKKLFQGIHKVQFNDNNTQIVAMISSANEVVTFLNPVPVSEKVEDWLDLLATEMQTTLAFLLSKCLSNTKFDWSYPSQILCLSQAIKFTDDAEAAIEEGKSGLDALHKQLKTMLREFTSHDLSGEPLVQLKMKSLVLDIVHHIDVVEQLQKKKTYRTSDWQWKKQLRYYFEQGKAVVRMHDAKFDYTYEYQGNAPKLVHTPLTDKCYLTLTQGMHMGFGGNPYGPAGTGKTESVKALASCLGRQVLVFNCDEALESSSMVRIFIGIVKCGAWGCFDEFNRLKEDQLSAISQQIQIIQDAIKLRTSPIQLLGRSVDVNFNSGIFVTLNPAGKGYGGRSRLPDNLKALFRPVAMGAPDNELIADVSLVTEGFTQSKDLASKIVSLFKLSKQLLTPQQHYDWGLRALKAVLNSGGRLIQSYKSQGRNVDSQMEYEILIKAVRVNTLSKLTFGDTSKFLNLIGDVFPGVKSADITGGELEAAIKEVIKEKPFYLVEDPAQIKKMIQLKESLDQRMGCVIVGPSGCGKSSLWRVLKAAMIKCGQPVVTHVMNPKSMHRERLLGHMDMDTREWADGVLTDAARKVVREPSDVRCWIICDGDVDPEWIESLNSVLDDNHLLTLPNGERISFGNNVNFLFETHDLRFASPATVSRMGMIFLSDEDLDVTRLITRWLATFPQERRLSMSSWIDELFYKALDFVLRSDVVVDTTLVGTVMNGLSQVKNASSRQEFICGLIRGIGGNLSLTQRAVLANEVFQWANERPSESGSPLDCYADGGSFYSFQAAGLTREKQFIDIKDIGESAVIPTVSVQRTLAAMESWITNMEPFILVGPEGCGKSMMIKHAFRQKRNIGIATLHCNAQTTADDVINKIAQTCSLFSSPDGRVYRPRDCERLVLYLKDINLPRPDMYDTCQLIAFLQQLITFDGFYDEALEFLKLERIQIVASINAATTVGRHPLSTRFTAVVRIGVVDYPETNELVSVYDAFLSAIIGTIPLGDKRWLQPSERERLASTIVDIYQKTREKFSVDDRRHYLFTPRDMTTWVRNICRYDLSSEDILDVISNEACRLFKDRLVGSDACNRFDQQLAGIMRTQFRHTIQSDFFYTSLTSARGGGSSAVSSKKGGDSSLDNLKEVVGSRISRMSGDDFQKLVSQGVMYYEREEKDLNMLLFPEILEHIAHVDRILSSFSGHILMAGRCGVGGRHIIAIVAYMLGYELYTPALSRDYDAKNFSNDVKSVLHTAGIKGEHIILLVEDFQITTESILETVNSLLSSGEVPGLYTHEELEPLLSPLREKMKEEGGFRTPYEFFVSRVKKYLHVVLCMDPEHRLFLYRCESNPALYAQCSVMWLGEWRNSSLKMIPKLMEGVKSLCGGDTNEDGANSDEDEDEFGRGSGKSGESKLTVMKGSGKSGEGRGKSRGGPPQINGDSLIEMILSIHGSAVSRGATPSDFIAFLQTWYSLYMMKKKELQRDLGHLEAGLSKLDSATEVVNSLRTNAVQQQKDLAVAQTAADRAMEEISKALASASDRRNEVAEVKKTVAENESKTQARKQEIEGELAEIQPVLDDAKQAVGQIKSEHLNEIRSLNTPPEAIADVLGAVLMLLGVQDLSWPSMKKFLGNRGVKDDILNYDGKQISPELRKNVSKLIKKKSTSFEADTIRRVSIAAAPLASWVLANIKYSLVIEKIEPLEAELEEEVRKLNQSQKRLQVCEDELREIDDRVANLKKEFGNRTAEAERLKRNLAIAGTTLDKAERLIGQLGGEQARWKSQAEQLHLDLAKLPVKILLASGFATYLAKSPEDVRSALMATWQEIACIQSFSFKRVLSTESELLQWKSMGLPADDLSQENGLVIAQASSNRVPFIIDPASAATDWLKALLATASSTSEDRSRGPLEIVTHHDPRFVNQVELAVRFGKTLVILEVDGVEPMLYPLCRKDLCHQGPRFVVAVGDKVIDYNENFRLYLVTRSPDPDLPPDAAALVTQVNFTVTRSGLEGQLLGIAIQHEQPELEKAKGEMLRKEEDFKVQLAALEKNLLQTLATAEGNLLENTALIESLTRTKEKSAEIEEALVLSAEASVKLDQQREVYRPFAHSGSKLFFLVKSLQTICHMYQFSLASFLELFKQSLAGENTQVRNTEDRLSLLSADLEVRVLHFIGRALFKADRPMFALHLVKGMHADHFQPKEWEIFTGALVDSVVEGVPRGYPSWAPSERQGQFRLLTEHLPHLINSLELENTPKWQRFASSTEAERDIPMLRGVSPFQRVLLIQVFRPDRLQSAQLQFCTDMLRIDSISPPPLSLSSLYNESNETTPILLLSSPGADASKELQEFAAKTLGSGLQYDELAMGGGQQEVAIQMLRTAAAAGSWLCLKNLHLVVAWLPTLEKELSSFNPKAGFRLWLTSEAHNEFPSILLQQSLKATYESPPGIKKNLQRAFESWDVGTFNGSTSSSTANATRSRLFFLLACFHAVIQERRTYVPQGWTKFYEFSYGDMKAGTFVMEAASRSSGNGADIDWEAVYGLMEDAIYGGRIDNAYDLRVLRSYLNLFFSDTMAGDKSVGQEVLPSTPLRMPSSPDYESFKRVISQLPDTDAPFMFSLPDNIERSLQRTTSAAVIRQLRSLSASETEVGKYDRDKWRVQLSPILDQWQSMVQATPGLIGKRVVLKGSSKEKGNHNKNNNANAAQEGDAKGQDNSIDDFVVMESDLAGDICTMVDLALNSLKKVLFGSGLLSSSTQAVATALLSDTVPAEWVTKWDGGPDKPQAWLREVVRKRIALTKWRALSSKGTLLSGDAISLGDLFHPGIFVNALRQQTARELGLAIDCVKMVTCWDKDTRQLKRDCPLPCLLTGLLLQGASFHSNMLHEAAPDASELSPLQNIAIGFVNQEVDTYTRQDALSIPVYFSPSREDYLMDLHMPAGDKYNHDRWILAGVAIFLVEGD